jgi:hypothetical protein
MIITASGWYDDPLVSTLLQPQVSCHLHWGGCAVDKTWINPCFFTLANYGFPLRDIFYGREIDFRFRPAPPFHTMGP